MKPLAPRGAALVLIASLGCVPAHSLGPLCGSCDIGTQDARLASQVRLVNDHTQVAGCTKLGTVHGWEDLEKQNGAFWLAKNRGVYANGRPADVRVLFISGGDDEAYLCGGGVASNGARIRVLPDDSGAAGCTFVGAADESQPCPATYVNDRTKCISWRALMLGGNVVVDSTPPRVYQCPANVAR
jgi:hypothetical protein